MGDGLVFLQRIKMLIPAAIREGLQEQATIGISTSPKRKWAMQTIQDNRSRDTRTGISKIKGSACPYHVARGSASPCFVSCKGLVKAQLPRPKRTVLTLISHPSLVQIYVTSISFHSTLLDTGQMGKIMLREDRIVVPVVVGDAKPHMRFGPSRANELIFQVHQGVFESFRTFQYYAVGGVF